jgi:mannosyltransferase OCH1-like enzyme
MSIPKIIHQTWRDKRLPKAFQQYASTWKRFHPEWEYRLWTDRDNRRFIRTHYRWFLPQYDAYRWPIQRVDAIRYFLLYHYGGLYADLDFQCLRPFDTLVDGRSCVLGLEPQEHCREHGRERIVCNALMAARPGHEFFRKVTQELPNYADRLDTAQPILETTGPFMLTHVYDDFAERDTVDVMPPETLYPLSRREADEFRRTKRRPQELNGAYAVHFHVGSWWRAEELRGDGIDVVRRRPPRWVRRLRRAAWGAAAVTAASLLFWWLLK